MPFKIVCITAYTAAKVVLVLWTLSAILYPFARQLQNKFRSKPLKNYEHPFIDTELMKILFRILVLSLIVALVSGVAGLGADWLWNKYIHPLF